jgi:nitrate/nitrite-specific signal transduction histidine kinase
MGQIQLNVQKMSLYLWLSLTPLLALEISSPSHAVDISGKQRMYSQKMLKDYAMIGMNNQFGNPSEELKSTIDNFNNHLDLLLAYNQDTTIKEALQNINTAWRLIEKRLSSTATKEDISILQEDLETLLKDSDAITKLFAKASANTTGKIINISGKQRMLSQRMASLYMFKVWGIDDLKFKEKMTKAMALFKISSQRLMDAKMNTPKIKQLLHNANKAFMFFEMMNKSKSKFIPSLIYKKSDDILKDMNTVTGLYVKEENK